MTLPKNHEELLVLLDDGDFTEYEKVELVRAYAHAKQREEMAALMTRGFSALANKVKSALLFITSHLHLTKTAHG